MRYIQRFETDEIKQNYVPESYINITLPRKIVDLHTFTLYYTGYAQPAATGGLSVVLKRFFPRLNQSIISDLIIEIDGVEKQWIREFGYLFSILHDISREDEDVNGTAFDTILQHNIANDTGEITKNIKLQAETNPTNNTDEFYIDKWLGMLNEGNRYMDCTDKNVKIRIKLAPASILYRGVNTIGLATTTSYPSSYSLTNVYGTIDVLDEMPEQPISSKFVDYITVIGQSRTGDKKTSLSFKHSKPIKWLIGTFTDPLRNTETELLMSHCNTETKYGNVIVQSLANITAYNNKTPHQAYYGYDVAKLYKLPYTLNDSRYMQRSGKGILHCVFNINGFDITPKLSLLGCYKETKKCFGTEYKRVISLASFEEDFFCNAVRLDDNEYDFKSIQWDVTPDPRKFSTGGQPIIFVCTEGSY